MAAVPYDGGRRTRSRNIRSNSRSGNADPFGALVQQPHGMMQQMDKMFNGFFGGGGSSGGFSPFEAMERSMRDMRKCMDSSVATMGGELKMGSGTGGPGSFRCSRFVMTSQPDASGRGQAQVESFHESTVGGRSRGGQVISETQQAYQNSGTGAQRIAMEHALGGRARKVVRERRGGGGDAASTERELLRDVARGEGAAQFEQEWAHEARGVLPPRESRHQLMGGNAVAGLLSGVQRGGYSSGGGRQSSRSYARRAKGHELPTSSHGYSRDGGQRSGRGSHVPPLALPQSAASDGVSSRACSAHSSARSHASAAGGGTRDSTRSIARSHQYSGRR